MKHRTKLLLTLGVVVALGVGVYTVVVAAHGSYHDRYGGYRGHAATGAGMFGAGGHEDAIHMLETHDADGDGAIGLDEFRDGQAARFEKFDTDGDGTLGLAEFEALWTDVMRGRMVDAFQVHDHDGDGMVTAADFVDRQVERLRFMDRNGDGKIGWDDRRD